MGRSSIGYFTFDVHLKKRKNLDRDCSVDDVSGGYGVLPYFYSYLSFQKQVGVLKDTKRNRIYGIKEVDRWGDVVVVSVLAGLVGQEVELVNILNGESEGTLDDQHAAARECRLMLACPKGAGLAEFAMEYRDSENASFVAKTFAKQLRKLFPDVQAPINPKLEPEAWVKGGTLEQLSVPLTSVANRVELATGIDGDSNDEVVAVLKVVVEPLSKSGFPHHFWTKLYESRLNDNAYLELPDIVQERLVGGNVPISATVSSGTQRKSFLIGNEKTPAIREILTSDGEEYLSDRQFAHRAADAMLNHFRDIGFKLKSGWDSGDPEYSLLTDDPEWVENIDANNKG
jgi:hypothetical protein